MLKLHAFLKKFSIQPMYIGIVVGLCIAVLITVAYYARYKLNLVKEMNPPTDAVSLEQLKTDQAFYDAASAFQEKLKWHRQQYQQYPSSYSTLKLDLKSYDERFIPEIITYSVQGGDYNYSICIDVELVYNQHCFDKFTFLVNPHHAPNTKPTMSTEELQTASNDVIEIMQNWNLDTSGAPELLTKMYLSASDSAEFASANAWYRFQKGYLGGTSYLFDDWDNAKKYVEIAEQKRPDDIQQLRLAINMKLLLYEYEKADELILKLAKNHPESEWVQYFLAIRVPSHGARIDALNKLITRVSDRSVLWDGYWALLAQYECICNPQFFTVSNKMLAEFGPHPWVHQHVGNFLLYDGRYQEAIDEYEQGIAAGDIPALHINLADAYAQYGYNYYFFQRKDFDKALEYLHLSLDEAGDSSVKTDTYAKLVDVYRLKGLLEQSPDDLRKAIEYAQLYIDEYPYDIGMYAADKKRMEADLVKLEQNINETPASPQPLFKN